MKSALILIFLNSLLCSCGFRDGKEDNSFISTKKDHGTTYIDSDGDKISDQQEKERGSNPQIANIPSLKFTFLQDFQVRVKLKSKIDEETKEYLIDSKTLKDDPDFQYRIGHSFIRNESYRQASKLGKFSGHSTGEIKEHDLSWIEYPELPPSFYLKEALEFRKLFNPEKYEITDIELFLTGNAKLKDNSFFNSINNLSVNLFYYDFEKERYESLLITTIERSFNKGVNENFEILIKNVPKNLLLENFFKKGKFLITEISDYEIPDLQTTYKSLMMSVREKALPVILNTPNNSIVTYISTNANPLRLNKVLSTLVDKEFEIKNDRLVKIQHFENNLPDYSYLSELKTLNKKGKWFIFTNKLNKSLLDYEFTNNDIVSLSYVTGSELASQKDNQFNSLNTFAKSNKKEGIYELGNVSPNSQVDITLYPNKRWGEKLVNKKQDISSPGGSCGRNCIRREYECLIEINTYKEFEEQYVFSDLLDNELQSIVLLINNNEFNVSKLIQEKKVQLDWSDKFLNIRISDFSKLLELVEYEENQIKIKLIPSEKTSFNGVLLRSISGEDKAICPGIATNMAGINEWPLSIESFEFDKWKELVDWNKVKKGERKTYSQDFSIQFNSLIKNFYN